MVTWMIFWTRRSARTIKSELTGKRGPAPVLPPVESGAEPFRPRRREGHRVIRRLRSAGGRAMIDGVGVTRPGRLRATLAREVVTVSAREGRRAPGTLESEVMGVLWGRDEPVTAGDVQAEIGGDLAYNTVQTILIRLHEKGLVERRRAGRGHVYWPAQDAATAAADQMRAALAGRTDRQAVLRQFAASLDDADAIALRQLLSEARHRRT